MDEKHLYTELSLLTRTKSLWKEKISYVGSLFTSPHSSKITAKILWMLGEMGLKYPEEIRPYVKEIASFLNSDDSLLRERAVNALGRIGRADYELIQPYWEKLLASADDKSSSVRLSFIWASENIATHTPLVYRESIPLFVKLLDDEDTRVRIEAPEIFRVLGKRVPDYVRPYLGKLEFLSEHDVEKVVRVHAKGAIKAISAAR